MTKSQGLRFRPTPGACGYCGGPMKIRRCRLGSGRDKYCSSEHYHLATRTAVVRPCAYCGRDVKVVPSKAAQKRETFCSQECNGKAKRVGATLEEAFWARAFPGAGADRCWGVAGDRGAGGYTVFSWASKRYQAHRVSYLLHHGPIPKGKVVMHLCNVPACVNPTHLKLGTRAENNRHKAECGRAPQGETHYQARATEGLVREIRRRYEAREAFPKQLSRETGLSVQGIWAMIYRRSWRHIV